MEGEAQIVKERGEERTSDKRQTTGNKVKVFINSKFAKI